MTSEIPNLVRSEVAGVTIEHIMEYTPESNKNERVVIDLESDEALRTEVENAIAHVHSTVAAEPHSKPTQVLATYVADKLRRHSESDVVAYRNRAFRRSGFSRVKKTKLGPFIKGDWMECREAALFYGLCAVTLQGINRANLEWGSSVTEQSGRPHAWNILNDALFVDTTASTRGYVDRKDYVYARGGYQAKKRILIAQKA